MNKILIAALSLLLVGCGQPSYEEQKLKEKMQQERSIIHQAGDKRISVIGLQDDNVYYSVTLICVDGTTYLTHGQSIVGHVGLDGKPVPCGVVGKE